MAEPGIIGLTEADFTDNALNDLGTDVTWISRTKYIDNITGAATFVEASPVTIQGVFTKRALRFNWNKEGWVEMGDAYVMVPYSTTIKEEDYVEYDDERYRVATVLPRIPGTVGQFISVILFKVENV